MSDDAARIKGQRTDDPVAAGAGEPALTSTSVATPRSVRQRASRATNTLHPIGSGAKPGDSASLSLGPLTQVVGYHIAQAAVVTYGLFERFIGQPFDLRKTEFSMLMLLWANGPLSPKRLARALALSAPNLTMLLDRLQGRGLLRRERSEVDRRSQNIVLTSEGQVLARAAADAAQPMEMHLLDRLSRAEHAMLIELLTKVGVR